MLGRVGADERRAVVREDGWPHGRRIWWAAARRRARERRAVQAVSRRHERHGDHTALPGFSPGRGDAWRIRTPRRAALRRPLHRRAPRAGRRCWRGTPHRRTGLGLECRRDRRVRIDHAGSVPIGPVDSLGRLVDAVVARGPGAATRDRADRAALVPRRCSCRSLSERSISGVSLRIRAAEPVVLRLPRYRRRREGRAPSPGADDDGGDARSAGGGPRGRGNALASGAVPAGRERHVSAVGGVYVHRTRPIAISSSTRIPRAPACCWRAPALDTASSSRARSARLSRISRWNSPHSAI